MKIDEYISSLRNNNNIVISISDDKLDIVASKEDLTEEIIEEIKTKKEDILAFFNGFKNNSEEIKPVSKQEHYLLSHAQRRLWVLDQLVETQGLYNIPMINEFETLEMAAFEKALFDLIDRHETLRTTIHTIEGEPRQMVHSTEDFNFEVLSIKLQNDVVEELDDLIWRESFYPLDLTISPVRATLIEKTDGGFVLIFIIHHIMTDGWSVDVIKRDFLALYQHHNAGVPLDLPQLKFQYKDYSYWQQHQLRLGKLDQSRTYWHEKLLGKVPVLNLPLDNKREVQKNYNGASVAFHLSPEISNRIIDLGNKNGISIFMILVTMVKILLHRYTNQDEIILGTPVTGRNNPELENQVGFYNNVIVFCETIAGQDTFMETLLKVSATILEAYEHQYYPFDLLVDELDLERDMNRNPLFDVMVSYHDASDGVDEMPEYEFDDAIITTDKGVNKFDLSYSFVKEKNGSLFVDINYDTGLFKKEKLVRMAHHLKKLVSETTEDVQQKVLDIDFLPETERDQIIMGFNGENTDINLDKSIKNFIDNKVLASVSEIPNAKFYILDNNNKLLPIGIPGEIGIGGIAFANADQNFVALEQEKLIEDPYHPEYNQKIYKTGHIGYWNEKGGIELLDTINSKLNTLDLGLELGEIESAILEHPEVGEVAVVVNKDSSNKSHIVGYYVKNQQANRVLENGAYNSDALPSNVELVNKTPFQNVPILKDYNITSTIISVFEESVKRNPDAVALVIDGIETTYKELNKTAIKLAQVLKSEHEILKGDAVAILMSRSEKMIVSILGILKLGATYVPIDPDYPDTRITYMLKDSSAKLIVTDPENEEKIDAGLFRKFIFNAIERFETENVQLDESNRATAHDLCYVCYTSGSTGQPKGVMIEHHSVMDYVHTFTEYFAVSKSDTVIQQSSISFDTAVEEIFPILCQGGTLVIMPNGGRDVSAIIETINQQEVSILSTTPLVLNEINLRYAELTHHARIFISGGDALKSSQINQLIKQTKIYNTYGPTEATVCASFAIIDDLNYCNRIGKPIVNHDIYLLNEKMEHVAIGEIGEIYITGPGVARGYLNRPIETNTHFLPNPFGEGVFYKTGDLGRWDALGFLEFIGRNDDQVKIRGYRIEPAEVNKVIEKFDKIQNSHTTAQKDSEGNKHLVAYYIASHKFEADELRLFLKEQLPHYMVPAYLTEIEEFPRTVNGKINNKELPVPSMLTLDNNFNSELAHFLKGKLPNQLIPPFLRNMQELPLTANGEIDRKSLEELGFSPQEERIKILPKNDTEKSILEIWEKCLRFTGISTDSNFFEVGGDSLKATQVLSLIFKELNKNISLKDIFNNPTIIELSGFLVDQKEDKSLVIKLNTIKPELPNIFVIPPILGSSTIYRKLAANLNTRFNVYGLQYKGFDKDIPFDNSIEEMAVTFTSEIESLHKSNTVFLLGYSMGVPIAYEMAKILERTNHDVQLIFIDRGVHDNTSNKAAITKEYIETILDDQLIDWMKEVNKKDMARIKKMIFWNLNLLNTHRVKEKIQSYITTIEATQNESRARMDKWSKYTNGGSKHHLMDTDHFGIIADHKISIFTEIVSNTFSPQPTHHLTEK